MKKNNNKIIKSSIVDIFELLVIKNDYPDLMPNRIVKEYWTFEGEYIGSIDPLNAFSKILDSLEYKYTKPSEDEI